MSYANRYFFSDMKFPHRPIKVLLLNERYLFSPEYRMRRDRSRIILYRYSTAFGTLNGQSMQLHPRLAILLSLFDGKRTYREVVNDFRYIMDDLATVDLTEKGLQESIFQLSKTMDEVLVHPISGVFPTEHLNNPLDLVIPEKDLELSTRNPHLDFPLSVNFQLNIHCNRQCIYCYTPRDIPEPESLPLERFIELIDEAALKDAGEIQFTGADGLLHPNILPLTGAVIDRGYHPFISTKQRVSKERAAAFADMGLVSMQVSLDSTDKKIAAKMTGCPDYLDMAHESIRNLRECGIAVRIKAVATAQNIDGLPDLVREAGLLDVSWLMIDLYGRSLFRHEDDLFPSNESINRVRKELKVAHEENPQVELLNSLAEYNHPDETNRVEDWDARAVCSTGRTSISIMPDGKIIVCDQVPISDKFILGNVSNLSIADAWNAPSIASFVNPNQALLSKPCRECDDFQKCCESGGRCLRDVFIAYGDVKNADPRCPMVEDTGLRL